MNEKRQLPLRRKLAIAAVLAILAVAGAWTVGVTALTPGPDVTVINLPDLINEGGDGTYRGYAVGTTSCNIGDTPVWWCDQTQSYCTDEQHPVIAQNMYRLKDNRFQQLGMSWLKHGFLSTNSSNSACAGIGSCSPPAHGGDQLQVGCTDTYDAGLNDNRPLGKRSEVNATTGVFPYPYGGGGSTAQSYDQRLKVLQADIDPAQNSGAKYWVEGHYVTQDDAAAGNGLNNASYRQVSVNATTFSLSFVGGTVREKAAISAWPVEDNTVQLIDVDVASSTPLERFNVARKVTDNGGGNWHYEYAIHNMNSDRSARALTITFPHGTITNAGFYGVKHHSGEPYATTDWAIDTTVPGTVSWLTTEFAVDANANALRWGTMFNFWFDSTAPPAGISQTLELFKPGSPTTLAFSFTGDVTDLFADGFETGNTSAWSLAVP